MSLIVPKKTTHCGEVAAPVKVYVSPKLGRKFFKPRRRKNDGRPCKTLCIYWLRRSVTTEEIRAAFSRFGAILDVIKPEEQVAYVVFERQTSAKAMKRDLDLQRTYRDGTSISVTLRGANQKCSGYALRVDYSHVPAGYRHLLQHNHPAAKKGTRSTQRKVLPGDDFWDDTVFHDSSVLRSLSTRLAGGSEDKSFDEGGPTEGPTRADDDFWDDGVFEEPSVQASLRL